MTDASFFLPRPCEMFSPDDSFVKSTKIPLPLKTTRSYLGTLSSCHCQCLMHEYSSSLATIGNKAQALTAIWSTVTGPEPNIVCDRGRVCTTELCSRAQGEKRTPRISFRWHTVQEQCTSTQVLEVLFSGTTVFLMLWPSGLLTLATTRGD